MSPRQLNVLLKNIEDCMNLHLDLFKDPYFHTHFIIYINAFLVKLPKKVTRGYHWIRPHNDRRPSLFLSNINRQISFHKDLNCYKIIFPSNLDLYL